MRYLAVDYGTKRIGLAVCDELEITASPLAQIDAAPKQDLSADAQAVARFAAEYDVAEYVVGLPYNMDGSSGPQAQLCQQFAEALGETTSKPVHLFDERLTSEAAEDKLLDAGLTSKKRRSRTDMIAAAIILQSFLEARNEDSRRAYWSRSMDQAHKFMEQVIDLPVVECSQSMSFLPDVVARTDVEVTFSKKPHADGLERLHYLREGLIDDFINIAGQMNRLGWVLHIEDAFRSRSMQRGLARQPGVFDKILARTVWELGGKKPEPGFLFRRLSALIATVPKVGTHMSGSALDVSVFRRDDGTELDRGAHYLEMSELTPMSSPFVDRDAQNNRKQITAVFQQFGFRAYPYEFWHYSKGDAFDAVLQGSKQPVGYGPVDFDPVTRRVTPIENAAEPLSSLDDIRNLIANAGSPR